MSSVIKQMERPFSSSVFDFGKVNRTVGIDSMFDKKRGSRFSPGEGTRELDPTAKRKKNKKANKFPAPVLYTNCRRFVKVTDRRGVVSRGLARNFLPFRKPSLQLVDFRHEYSRRRCSLSLSLSLHRRLRVQEIGRILNFPFVSQHLEV